MGVPSSIDTVVVGAGQAGLAMSWHLSRASREHVVLERRASLGGGWQDRWNEFCLVSPNWASALPGFPYDGPDPDGFMPRDAIAARIARYGSAIGAPVVLEAAVERVVPRATGGFIVRTTQGEVTARSVVVATGAFHGPKAPAIASALPPRVLQLHSHDYRQESDLPPGAVLVVGSAQTGMQLAEELYEAGRRVYLSVGSAGRVPRRYRGSDIFRWLTALGYHAERLGIPFPTIDRLPSPAMRYAGNPSLSGHNGGHDTNLREFARRGITLLGRMTGVDGDRVELAPDLLANMVGADRFFDVGFRPLMDAYIAAAGIDAPTDEPVRVEFEPKVHDAIDLGAAGIGSVLWTTGYAMDFGFVDAPILDEHGAPRTHRGVSEVPGLFFVGLLWQHTRLSATLPGIALEVRHIAGAMGLPIEDAAAVEPRPRLPPEPDRPLDPSRAH